MDSTNTTSPTTSQTATICALGPDERLSIIARCTPHSMALFDREMRYVFVTESWLKDYRLLHLDVIGRSHYDIFPEITDEWRAFHRRGLDGEVLRCDEDHFVRSNGDVQWLKWEIRPWSDDDGHIGGILISTEDITERKRAEEKLKRDEAKFRTVFEQAAIGMGRIRCADRTWIEVNETLCRMLGLDANAMLTQPWDKNASPEDVEPTLDPNADSEFELVPEINSERLDRLWRGEIDRCIVTRRFTHPTGKYVWTRLTLSLARDSRAKPDHVIAVIEDISDAKRIEDELRASETRFRPVIESMSEGLMLFDSEKNLIFQNPASLRIHGFDLDADGKIRNSDLPTTWEAWNEEERPITFEEWPVSRVFRGERFQDQLLHVRRVETGEEFYASYNGSPIYDSSGQLRLGFITIRNITAQRGAEQALTAERDKLDAIVKNVDVGIGLASADGSVLTLNPAGLSIFGFESNDLNASMLSGEAEDFEFHYPDGRSVPPDELPLARARNQDYVSDFDLTLSRPSRGWTKHLSASVVPLPHPSSDVAHLLFSVSDVTQRRTFEERLRISELRFKALVEASSQLIWATDATGEVREDSPSWRAFTGQCFDEFTGWGWLDAIHPDDKEAAESAWIKATRTATIYETEYRVRHVSGEWRWMSARGVPLLDRDGRVSGWVGMNSDITDRKHDENELRRAREQAESANEMKSAFLANMSHEIRTPLGAILGFTDLLTDPNLKAEERANYQSIVKKNGEVLSSLIDDILDLSKVEAGQLKIELVPFSLRQLVHEVCSLLSKKAEDKRLGFDCRVDDSVPELIGSDPTRIRQILTNVIGNAIKFTSAGRVQVIAQANGDTISFSIFDTGIGITSEQLALLFKPFAQADASITRQFGGTGLGLILSREMAVALGGDLILKRSSPGQGSEFEVRVRNFALKAQPTPDARLESHSSVADGLQTLDGLKLLLVDDAVDNQLLISRILRKHGAAVEVASNGAEALDKARDGKYDMVLMDLQMPVMDGYTATHLLRERGYRKPIIALTAHAMNKVRDKCLRLGFDEHLTKPLKTQELLICLNRYRKAFTPGVEDHPG